METVLDGTLYISWSAFAGRVLGLAALAGLSAQVHRGGTRKTPSLPPKRATSARYKPHTPDIENKQDRVTPDPSSLPPPQPHPSHHTQTNDTCLNARPHPQTESNFRPRWPFIHSFNELAGSLAIRGNRATPAPNEVNVYAQTNRQTRPTLPTRATAQQTAATFSPEHIYTRSLPPPPHHTIPPKHSTRPLLERRR